MTDKSKNTSNTSVSDINFPNSNNDRDSNGAGRGKRVDFSGQSKASDKPVIIRKNGSKDVTNASAQTYYSLSKSDSTNSSIAEKLKIIAPLDDDKEVTLFSLPVDKGNDQHIRNKDPEMSEAIGSTKKVDAVNSTTKIVMNLQLDMGAVTTEVLEIGIIAKSNNQDEIENAQFKEIKSGHDSTPSSRGKHQSAKCVVSKEKLDLILMNETNLMTSPQNVPNQYIHTLTPLPDTNASSVLDLLQDKTNNSVYPVENDDGLSRKLGKLTLSETDVYLWGIPIVQVNPDSASSLYPLPAKKDNALSHLPQIALSAKPSAQSVVSTITLEDGSSKISLTTIKTRMILEIQRPRAESFSGRPSSYNTNVAFKLKLDSNETLDNDANQVEFTLDCRKNDNQTHLLKATTSSDTITSSHVYTDTTEPFINAPMVTLELDDSGQGTTVHYKDGDKSISKVLKEDESPLAIKLSVDGVSKSSTMKPEKSILKISVSAANNCNKIGTGPIVAVPDGGPVKMKMPTVNENMCVTLTTQIVKDEREWKTKGKSISIVEGKDGVKQPPIQVIASESDSHKAIGFVTSPASFTKIKNDIVGKPIGIRTPSQEKALSMEKGQSCTSSTAGKEK